MSSIRTPHRDDLPRMARGIIQREVVRQIGPDGIETCLLIGGFLEKAIAHYHDYAKHVGEVEVELASVEGYFHPDVWAKMSNNQRLTVYKAVQKEGDALNGAIQAHIKYLGQHRQAMGNASPEVQARIAGLMAAMQNAEQVEVEPEGNSEIE